MSPGPGNLGLAARAVVKEAVWLFTRYEQGPRPNICLFATRRGGSTWLAEIIAANKGVRALDQPDALGPNLTPGAFRAIPKFDHGELVAFDEEEAHRVRRYFAALLDGRLQVNAPFRIWRPEFDFKADRLVLKLDSSKAIIDWIDRSFPVQVVYLTRHPIPQALSCIANGWNLTVKPYLRNPLFVAEHLDPDTVEWAWSIVRDGTPLQQFTLNWAIENLVPQRLLPHRPGWVHVAYEDCVLEPEATIERLAASLQLDDVNRMLATVNRPSITSGRLSSATTRKRIASGDRSYLVERWRSSVTTDEERAAFAILERLGITMYQPGAVMPVTR